LEELMERELALPPLSADKSAPLDFFLTEGPALGGENITRGRKASGFEARGQIEKAIHDPDEEAGEGPFDSAVDLIGKEVADDEHWRLWKLIEECYGFFRGEKIKDKV
jgi:hypothetical protein